MGRLSRCAVFGRRRKYLCAEKIKVWRKSRGEQEALRPEFRRGEGRLEYNQTDRNL
jgi:hypothetical protein